MRARYETAQVASVLHLAIGPGEPTTAMISKDSVHYTRPGNSVGVGRQVKEQDPLSADLTFVPRRAWEVLNGVVGVNTNGQYSAMHFDEEVQAALGL